MKLKQTSSDLEKSRPHSKIAVPSHSDVSAGVWKDASDLASKVGYDKTWKAVISGRGTYHTFDDYVDWSRAVTVIFYAFDENDANDRLKVLMKKKFSSEYTSTSPVQVSRDQAEGIVRAYSDYQIQMSDLDSKQQEEQKSDPANYASIVDKYFKLKCEASNAFLAKVPECKYYDSTQFAPRDESLCNHILALPTSKMMSEMQKSADWAVQLVQKMHDDDEKKLKEQWLKTPAGLAWKRKFDEEQLVLKRKEEREEEKRQMREEAEVQSAEISLCLQKKSTAYPQFNCGVVPVEVVGGRKFRGRGYVYAIETVDSSYGYYGSDSQTDIAKIFCPQDAKSPFAAANLKFCRIDQSVSEDKCKQAFESFCQAKVNSTLDWCRSKGVGKPESEIQKWAANIIKKHMPQIDVKAFFPDLSSPSSVEDKVKSTVKWALSLGYPQRKTNYILQKSFAKKGIDPSQHREVISKMLQDAYGECQYAF